MNFFEEFVSNYDFSNSMISLKYKHSLRVKILCELIARENNLSEDQIKLAGVCGLFHDIGRFEQITKHDTMDDLVSLDHGDLGYDMFLNRFADKLGISEKDKMIVAKSIKYHNKYAVEDVTEEERLFADILRDADKIDILYIYANIPGIMSDGDGDISQKCHDEFMKRKAIKRSDISTEREKIVLGLAFVWDIKFDCSYKIIKENKYYSKIQQVINNSIFDEYFNEIERFMKEK